MMGDLNQTSNSKEEESQSPAANKTSSEEDKCDEDMSWSEQELRQLFKLVRSRGLKELLEGKAEPTKRLSVVCKLCSFVADRIEEGSSFQDSHAAHRHASLHRDCLDEFPTECDEDSSMTPIPNYSEAELLRIYLVESYTRDYRRPGVPPPKKPAVSYLVVCKICKRVLSTTRIYPTCLDESLYLQEHASLHSEYLCMDGPAVPELDLEDYKKDWVLGYEGEIRAEDLYTPMEEGYVRICRRCYSENCSSGFYMASSRRCYICDTYTHWDWDCPKWEFERPTPCNGLHPATTFPFKPQKGN